MSGRHWRGAALLPAGVFAVHQLRLLLEFGSGEGGISTAHGHLHVASVLEWVLIALAVAVGGLLTHVARGVRRADGAAAPAPSTLALWGATAGSLVGLHALHEALEGLLTGGPGLLGLVGLGGLCALLAALAVGGLIALALRGARSLIVAIARSRIDRPERPSAAARMPRPRSAARRLAAPLSRSAAGRAPPAPPRLAA